MKTFYQTNMTYQTAISFRFSDCLSL